MQTAPLWLTALIPLVAALIGALSAIIAAWLTQKQDFAKQMAIHRLENDQALRQAMLKEKQQRCLTILQHLESLTVTPKADIEARRTLLRAVRESWLFGDDDLVRAIGAFLNQIANTPAEANPYELAIGKIVLLMRKDLGLPTGTLTTSDFRFHGPGTA